MRNLKLVSHRETSLLTSGTSWFQEEENAPREIRTFLSLDFDAGLTFVARGRVITAVGDDIANEDEDDATSPSSVVDNHGSSVRWRVELALKDRDEIVGIHWSLENEALVVATKGGELLLLKPPPFCDDPSLLIPVDDFEEVGCIASGCHFLAASPDEELLLLLTGDSTFVLMTAADFDPITEDSFADENRKESEAFVNVGWGKKETQFHGSEGKAAALAPKSIRGGVGAVSPHDDGQTSACWRADGQHFAISFLRGNRHPAGGDGPEPSAGRVIRVYARDGTLFSTSEDVAGLEQALHWRPSGSLLASSVRRPNKHEIAFFEPNGLRHGEFTLPFGTDRVKVQALCWNPNSDILAVALEEVSSSSDSIANFLQLWTIGNYHWYLKQTLVLYRRPLVGNLSTSTSTTMLWDGLAPNRLHVVGGDGKYRAVEWSWGVHRSNSVSPSDLAQVSVIDGDVVKVTPFRLLNVPPPMAAYELKVPFFVNALSCCPWWVSNGEDRQCDGKQGSVGDMVVNGLAVLGTSLDADSAGLLELMVYGPAPPPMPLQSAVNDDGNKDENRREKRRGFKTRATPLELKTRFRVETPNDAFPSQFVWVAADTFVFVTGGNRIWLLQTSGARKDNESIGSSKLLSSPASPSSPTKRIHSIQPRDSETVLVQFDDGQFQRFNFRSSMWGDNKSMDDCQRRQCADELILVNCDSAHSPSVLSFSARGALVVDGDMRLSDSATSMALHRDFLLYTTTRHELVALRLRDSKTGASTLNKLRQILTDRGVAGGAGNSDLERRFIKAGVAVTRAVERGARLVVCCASETGVVLQMPRGNLETVHPRALLLSSVERHLSCKSFYDAVVAMRRHRLNMNLIHDFDPNGFFDNVDEFVKQVDDPQLINLFLTDLEEKDVCSTMYEDYFGAGGVGGGEEGRLIPLKPSKDSEHSKVNAVCDVMIAALKKAASSGRSASFLTSILTAMAKKSPPAIADALAELRAAQAVDEKEADSALKYLVSLVDVDRLFDEALGTYDLRSVVMVAEKSQKDPKEYLPFLNSLNSMQENMRKYTIDVHLKRWQKALVHIHNCGEEYFQTHLIPLTEEHVLYSEALKLFDRRSSNYKFLSSKFGAFLIKKRRYREAGVVLSRVGDYQQALRAFQLALDWRQAICMAAYLKLSPGEISSLAREMAESLKNVDKTTEAAALLEQYADDVEEAITILIEGHEWDEALRLMHKHGRIDFIESDFKDAIVQAGEELATALDALEKDFVRHSGRLVIVRKEKLEAAKRREAEESEGLYGEGGRGGGREDDLYSDASSMSGVSDATSSKSARSNASSSFTKISERNANRAVKKKEKKMRSLKEGGPYEHLALVEALHTILVNVEKLKPDIHRLLKVQAQFFYEEEGLNLSNSLAEFQSIIDEGVKRIWPSTTDFNTDPEDASMAAELTRSFDRLRLGPNATADSIARNYASASPFTMQQHPDRLDFHLLAPHLQHAPSAMTVGVASKEEEFRMNILDDASGTIVHRSKKLES